VIRLLVALVCWYSSISRHREAVLLEAYLNCLKRLKFSFMRKESGRLILFVALVESILPTTVPIILYVAQFVLLS